MTHQPESHRPSLAAPAFPDDDGLVDASLASALGDDVKVAAAFGAARVFVPIVAVLGERATDGSDNSADMAAVLITGRDGRTALLAFSSVALLQAWNPVARPVPVWGRDAVLAARDEGASAILLDLGTDHFVPLELGNVSGL
jgi:hypothetical protein